MSLPSLSFAACTETVLQSTSRSCFEAGDTQSYIFLSLLTALELQDFLIAEGYDGEDSAFTANRRMRNAIENSESSELVLVLRRDAEADREDCGIYEPDNYELSAAIDILSDRASLKVGNLNCRQLKLSIFANLYLSRQIAFLEETTKYASKDMDSEEAKKMLREAFNRSVHNFSLGETPSQQLIIYNEDHSGSQMTIGELETLVVFDHTGKPTYVDSRLLARENGSPLISSSGLSEAIAGLGFDDNAHYAAMATNGKGVYFEPNRRILFNSPAFSWVDNAFSSSDFWAVIDRYKIPAKDLPERFQN